MKFAVFFAAIMSLTSCITLEERSNDHRMSKRQDPDFRNFPKDDKHMKIIQKAFVDAYELAALAQEMYPEYEDMFEKYFPKEKDPNDHNRLSYQHIVNVYKNIVPNVVSEPHKTFNKKTRLPN
jgi:hypothetical protein